MESGLKIVLEVVAVLVGIPFVAGIGMIVYNFAGSKEGSRVDP
jgi:hypothetical protein